MIKNILYHPEIQAYNNPVLFYIVVIICLFTWVRTYRYFIRLK